MQRLRTLARTVWSLSLLMACWFSLNATAWAQEKKSSTPGKSYVLSYMMVALIVGLGLLLVLRPPGRSTDVKPKSD